MGIGNAPAQGVPVKAVYLKGNELFTVGADGEQKQLTHDGMPKRNPLWSKDGTRIAFERDIDESVALDDLIVIDSQTGNMLEDIRVCPVGSGEMNVVRYIEGIEWLTKDRIAAKGSINPSATQTFVYDVKTGKELIDYPDDAGGAVFSPDGEHAATIDGMQHFSQESDRAPELDIDNLRVYPAEGVHISVLSNPAWSEDSTKVAVVTADYQSKQRSAVICWLNSSCKSTPLPAGNTDGVHTFQIQWSGSNVSANSSEGAWSLQPGDARAVAATPALDFKPNAYDTPLSLQDKIQKLGGDGALSLLKQVQQLGGVEPDLWCQSCALTRLPRRAPNH
jgi:dipeptidyl aminopeptidase/acylaminoacyl peptidase